ncbi:MAG TPA: C25 family cysteine peptidase, partial [Anaerolineales bacterium]|nr:C25 family cysteine peptidase [Anaerolineales bacterium]
VITKTLDYSAKDYGKTAVFAADKFDGIVSFKETNASLQTGLPADWSIQNINLDDQVVSLAKQQLLTAMNQGTALVVYNGHSGPKFWTFDQLFTTDDASALTNSGKPFLVVQWGCWNTYTLDPTRENLAQSLLFSGDKGAAVVMGAMGRADSNSEYQLGLLLTPRMTTQGMTIGQALFESKQILGQSNPEKLDVLLGWSLLGDPAVVVSP